MSEMNFQLKDIDERVKELESKQLVTTIQVQKLDSDIGAAVRAIEKNTKATERVYEELIKHMSQEERDRSKILWTLITMTLGFAGSLIIAVITLVPWTTVFT